MTSKYAMAIMAGLVIFSPNLASATDLDKRTDLFEPAPAGQPDWSGLYTGLNGGYGWGERETSLEKCKNCFDPVIVDLDNEGWLAGVTVGANAQRGSVVFGFEADAALTGIEGSDSLPTVKYTATKGDNGYKWDIDSEVEYFGTLRARAGVLLSPALLAYATGGAAWARINETHHAYDHVKGVPAKGWTSETTNDHFGWTAGGGLEWEFQSNWTLKGEYLYVDLGEVDYVHGPDVTTSDLDMHIIRAGLNYRF